MNKNGFLLAEETLKLIISVIAIGFLAYLLFSLYQANKDSKDLELAKDSLNFLMNGIKTENKSVDIYNPDGWWLNVLPRTETLSNGRQLIYLIPKTCSNLGLTSCICLCSENTPKNCDEKGICLDNKGFLIDEPIKIEDPPITIKINYNTKKISEEQ